MSVLAVQLKRLFFRIRFAVRHRTVKRIAVDPPGRLVLCGHSGTFKIPKYCPHQGAPLMEGRVSGDYLVCSWHGCKYRLSDGKFIVPKGIHDDDSDRTNY